MNRKKIVVWVWPERDLQVIYKSVRTHRCLSLYIIYNSLPPQIWISKSIEFLNLKFCRDIRSILATEAFIDQINCLIYIFWIVFIQKAWSLLASKHSVVRLAIVVRKAMIIRPSDDRTSKRWSCIQALIVRVLRNRMLAGGCWFDQRPSDA